MTPEQLAQFEELKRTVDALVRVENVSFIESIKRRLDLTGNIRLEIGRTTLDQLADVDAPAPSNGQVLKYTTSGTDRWIAGTDIDT